MVGNWPVYKIVPSPLYEGLLYCQSCQAHYPPNQEWGLRTRGDHNDTSGRERLVGIHRKGTECPFCGMQYDGG